MSSLTLPTIASPCSTAPAAIASPSSTTPAAIASPSSPCSTMQPAITSPSVPDLDEVRAWIQAMITALRFADLIAAIMYLITRMRDINLELMTQIVNHRRARAPRRCDDSRGS
jgi:hypothetical protein